MESRKMNRGRKVQLIALSALFALAMIALFADIWYALTYGHVNFDSILFTLTSDLSGTSSALFWDYVLKGLLPAVLVSAAGAALMTFVLRKPRVKRWTVTAVACAVSIAAITFAAFDAELVDYLFYGAHNSHVYDNYYVDPNDTKITFPKQKRNLVYIVLESMETSFLSEDLGGAVAHNLIPELYALARDNTNFSQNDGVGGFRANTGATWTVGSLTSQTGGVPLVPLVSRNERNDDGEFLPGLTTLTDILHENGYYQAFMLGSSSAFADTGLLYSTHGADKVYDVYTARKDGIVPPNYWDGWWGMEDHYTFEYAKQVLTEISAQEQPFAFTVMTIDTHQVGGHVCKYCQTEYEEQYDNVISCSDRQVAAFVQWLTEQDFYENTAVVIVGDHCSMDAAYFRRNAPSGYVRRVYNCFLNSSAYTAGTKNREFTTFDLFPTTLAAMGCTIDGDRLGLGTNLFSGLDTLTEKLGYETLCGMLYSNKEFYVEKFRLIG